MYAYNCCNLSVLLLDVFVCGDEQCMWCAAIVPWRLLAVHSLQIVVFKHLQGLVPLISDAREKLLRYCSLCDSAQYF